MITKKRSTRASRKRDLVLLALADAGDLTFEMLFRLSMAPIAFMQINQHAWDYGMGGDPEIDLGIESGSGKGLFRSIVELRIYVARLRRQGLVVNGKRTRVSITVSGRKLIASSSEYPSFLTRYPVDVNTSKTLIMVIFDVPMKYNRERDWLRFHLKCIGYRYVQGSVWLGQTALPRPFIEDMQRFKIDRWVHIFPIDRAGTISSLLKRFGFDAPSGEN